MPKRICNAFVFLFAFVLTVGMPLDNEVIGQENSEIKPSVDEEFEDLSLTKSVNNHLSCFQTLTIDIEYIISNTKEVSGNCLTNGGKEKQMSFSKLKDKGSEIALEIKRIQDSLTACTKTPVDQHYFECLKDIIEEDKRIAEDVAKNTLKYSKNINEIESKEHNCLIDVIDEAKIKSRIAFESLESCLGAHYPTTTTTTTSTTERYDCSRKYYDHNSGRYYCD